MTAKIQKAPHPWAMPWWKALLLALPMGLLSAMLLMGSGGPPEDGLMALSLGITWLMLNAVFFLMLKTGQTHRYRWPMFTLVALAMFVTFAAMIKAERGSVALTEVNMIQGQTPFCHLVIPMVLLPAAITGTVIFPGSMLEGFASIGSMLVIWFGMSLVLGRAWCSWTCFYGGWDEGASHLAKKARIKKIDRKWTYLPYAMLLFIVLMSALTLSPTYCEWFCPFKAVTEYPEVNSLLTLIQTIIFVVLFAGLVIVLPILTRKRIQCGLFCPFGAMQSFTNKVNVFDVRIDTEKCTQCGLCVRTCPTFSLDDSCLESGQPLLTCTKCGQCIDACPQKAISFHVKGTKPHLHPQVARVLFLYPAYLSLVVLGGGTVAYAIWSLLKWVTTGQLF